MEIKHKTTVADKVREIKKNTKWKQKEIAQKLGVTEKTVSLWVNGKARPSESQEEKIDVLYHEVLYKSDRRARIWDLAAEIQVKYAETGKYGVMAEEEALYYGTKQYIMEKENKNDDKIYLIPTRKGKEDEWYILIGRSLLFYKYFLAKRLGRTVNIQDDRDQYLKVRAGIGSAKWGDKLIDAVEKLGYKAERIEQNIIVIHLGKKYTKKEIKDLERLADEDRNKLKKIIKPKKTYPKLHMMICEFLRMLPSKVRKINKDYRDTLGAELIRAALDLEKLYYRLANDRMEKRDVKLEMLERTDDLMALMIVMDEGSILNLTSRTRMGECIVKIRNEVEEAL